MVSFIVL